jgi:hypothetical protein
MRVFKRRYKCVSWQSPPFLFFRMSLLEHKGLTLVTLVIFNLFSLRDETGKSTGMILRPNGQEMKGSKIKVSP